MHRHGVSVATCKPASRCLRLAQCLGWMPVNDYTRKLLNLHQHVAKLARRRGSALLLCYSSKRLVTPSAARPLLLTCKSIHMQNSAAPNRRRGLHVMGIHPSKYRKAQKLSETSSMISKCGPLQTEDTKRWMRYSRRLQQCSCSVQVGQQCKVAAPQYPT